MARIDVGSLASLLLMLLAGCAGVDRDEALGVVEAYQDRANRHALDEVVDIFTEDATWYLGPRLTYEGRDEIRRPHALDAATDARLDFEVLDFTENGVRCLIREDNAVFEALELGPVAQEAHLLIRDGRIASLRAIPRQESEGAARRLEAFYGWLRDERSEFVAEHFDERGQLIGPESASALIEVARTWAQENPRRE